MNMERKSQYYLDLSSESQLRYESKVISAGRKEDPYALEESFWTDNPDNIPLVNWSDVMLYMVSTPSPYTREALKAWKGMLDSENFVKSGWVHGLQLYEFTCTKFVVKGKVKHCQRVSAAPLLPWVIITKEGEILATHCTCMAGLGEACSHIAAILSCLVRATQMRQKSGVDSCTSQLCSWLPVPHQVSPALVHEIQFCKKRPGEEKGGPLNHKKIAPPSRLELDAFFETINNADKKPAFLKVTPPYAETFVPLLCRPDYPPLLTDLYKQEYLHLEYLALIQECERVFDSVKISSEHVTKVELATRGQATNKMWFVYRSGRITGSMFKLAARTNPALPSQSLIKPICYPGACKFSTVATSWGCTHEKDAIEAYTQQAKRDHQNVQICECGFFIDTQYPYVGASPDGITECDCCGRVVLEVKCPYCYRDALPDEEKENFCMTKKNGKWQLRRDHAYYYQIQLQIKVCQVKHCEFVVWTDTGIATERVPADDNFVLVQMDKVKHFCLYGILPEILGKWYSRRPIADSHGVVQLPSENSTSVESNSDTSDDGDSADKLWCYCNGPERGDMIMCESSSCAIVWFHFDCLRITFPPKGKSFCPSCRKAIDSKKKPKRV